MKRRLFCFFRLVCAGCGVSCRYGNLTKIEGMRRRSEHFGAVSYSTSIGCTFISGLIGMTTIFGNGLSRGGVGLKYVIFSQAKK